MNRNHSSFSVSIALALSLLAGIAPAAAKTVTSGNIDLTGVAQKINDDMQGFAHKRELYVKEIRNAQSRVKDLGKQYRNAHSVKDKAFIEARTLKEASALIDLHERYYDLTLSTVENLLPELDQLQEGARNGVLGQAAELLDDPAFKRSMNSLYGNLGALSLRFSSGSEKRLVAQFLQDNEHLYTSSSSSPGGDFDRIFGNINHIGDVLRQAYASAAQKKRLLQHNKARTQIAVDLRKYTLVLAPIQHNLDQFDPAVFEMPEEIQDHLLDPLSQPDTHGTDSPAADARAEDFLRKCSGGNSF